MCDINSGGLGIHNSRHRTTTSSKSYSIVSSCANTVGEVGKKDRVKLIAMRVKDYCDKKSSLGRNCFRKSKTGKHKMLFFFSRSFPRYNRRGVASG